MKFFARKKPDGCNEILEELRKISEALETADASFNETADGDLIEALIFERSSLRARYSYLLKALRTAELSERKA